MINETLTKLLREVGTYQAEFKPLPLNSRPDGCTLPEFTGTAITLQDATPPDITKSCNYNYDPDTLYLEPFVPPNPCPEGLKVVDKTVKIFPVNDDPNLYSEFTLKIKKALDSACNYNMEIPDIIIPCHPLGPQFLDAATITVKDNNDGTTETSTIQLQQDAGAVCQWRMTGDVTIEIPEIPCPDGLLFKTGQLVIASTCSSIPKDTKLVKIKPTGNGSDPCTFDIQLPEITIPCYPAGPSFSGQSVVTITDRGTTTDTQTIDVAHGSSCCDFKLIGDLNLEIPCQDGIEFATKTFKIISTGPSVEPDTNKQLSVIKAADQCNFDIEFPDLEIPCYPDGPTIGGIVTFTVGNIAHPYRTQEVEIAAVAGQTCQFDLVGDIVIPMPDYTIECSELVFDGGVRVRLNSSAPWLSGGNNSIALEETQCGADLVGDLNLGLPNYVVNCGTLQFNGGINVIVNSGNGPTTIANTVALVPTSCGATLTGDIELTVPGFNFPCPNGYTVGGGITVNAGGTIIPANSANNSITLTRVSDANNTPANQCKVQLGGTLILPGSSGGGGFNYYNNWQSGFIYPAGSVVGQVHTEGGLCSYINSRITTTNDKEPNANQQLWRTLGCEGPKRSHPFRLMKLAPVGNGPDNWVKVIPDSKLVALGNEDLRPIRGLDTPFQLAKDEIVYLEAFYDNVGGTPVFHYAHIAKAVGHWDQDAIDPANPNGTIPHFYPMPYKRVTPVNATIVKNISTSECNKFILKYTDPAAELAYRTAVRNELDIILDSIAADNVRRRAARFIKAYALIGKVVGIEDNDTSADFVINDGTNSYGVQQVLNHHVKEVADNDDDIPILTLRRIHPAGIKELPAITSNTIPVPLDVLTDTLTFDIANIPALPGVAPVTIGVKDDQVHIYYTVNGSNPTINTLLEPGSFLYDPANKPRVVSLPTVVKAVAVHPLYRTSPMYIQVVQDAS